MGPSPAAAVAFMALTACRADTTATDDETSSETVDVFDVYDGRFDQGVMPASIQDGGYLDSVFINAAGDRIYFLHSILSPSVLDGSSTQEACSHTEASLLADHTAIPDLEWNTDLYFVEWEGARWSEPINLGAQVNSLAMECCMWLSDDETEIIFNTVSDLDGDGEDQDLDLAPTGNYRATRAHRDAEWGTPVPLPDDYGTQSQDEEGVRHDIHKAPSGNLYLWETFGNGDNLLRFGERIGGTYDDPVYGPPVTLDGSTNYETQVWVNDPETRLVFNHRQADGETELYTRERATIDDPWGPSAGVPTTGFADTAGRLIWGEPTFDDSEQFMIFVRFDTADNDCWTPDLMFSAGDPIGGFTGVTVLN